MYSLSAERGELLSGARDAYLQYIGRLEARLRARELAVVDEKLVRSERQRFEAEANLAQVRGGVVTRRARPFWLVPRGCGPSWRHRRAAPLCGRGSVLGRM